MYDFHYEPLLMLLGKSKTYNSLIGDTVTNFQQNYEVNK